MDAVRIVDRVEANGCLFVCFDSLHPINNLSSIKGRVFPELNQY